MTAIYIIISFLADAVFGWSIYAIAEADAEREKEEENWGDE